MGQGMLSPPPGLTGSFISTSGVKWSESNSPDSLTAPRSTQELQLRFFFIPPDSSRVSTGGDGSERRDTLISSRARKTENWWMYFSPERGQRAE